MQAAKQSVPGKGVELYWALCEHERHQVVWWIVEIVSSRIIVCPCLGADRAPRCMRICSSGRARRGGDVKVFMHVLSTNERKPSIIAASIYTRNQGAGAARSARFFLYMHVLSLYLYVASVHDY